MPLPDGRIAVVALEKDRFDRTLLFDPATGKFERLIHPNGQHVALLVPRRDGTFWARMTPGCRIDIFDGKSFQPKFDFSAQWKFDDVRTLLESTAGDLWIGGAHAAAVWRRGVFSLLGPAQGFTETAGFSFAEIQPGLILAGGRSDLLSSEAGGRPAMECFGWRPPRVYIGCRTALGSRTANRKAYPPTPRIRCSRTAGAVFGLGRAVA